MELASSGKRSSHLATPVQEWQHGVGERPDAIQYGRSGTPPEETNTAGVPPEPSTKPDSIGASGSSGLINILALNVRCIMCQGRPGQVRLLLNKYKASVAILSETETTHDYAATCHMEGFRAFCSPISVTGPQNKEAGVIMMVSEDLASA